MAGAMAREGDMLSGHGSFPPHPFPVGGSIAKDAFIEGVKILCVGSIDTAHPPSVSPSDAPDPPPKIDKGSPTVTVMTVNGDLQPVARIGDTLSCGCTIMGGGNTVGGGANG